METRINVGTLTFVIDTPTGFRPTKEQVSAQVEATLAAVQDAIRRRGYPFEVEFEVLYAVYGCIKAKARVWIIVGAMVGLLEFVAKYHDLRDSIGDIFKDARSVACLFAKDVNCRPTLQTNGLVKQLHEVKPGQTLQGIVKSWPPKKGYSEHQMMQATVRQNPHAFVDGDMNRLRAGAIISYPTDEAFKGITTAAK